MKETLPQHIDDMTVAWMEYTDYCHSLGLQVRDPDFAFKTKTREVIKEEALHSPYPGYDFGDNQCSHNQHGKGEPYEDPDNGEYINKPDHYTRHRLASEGEIDNNISPEGNKWCSKAVWESMPEDQRFYLWMKANGGEV